MTTTPEKPADGRQPNAAEGMAREGAQPDAQPDAEPDRDAHLREADDTEDKEVAEEDVESEESTD